MWTKQIKRVVAGKLAIFFSGAAIVSTSWLIYTQHAFASHHTSSESVNVSAVVMGPPPSTPAVITSPKHNTRVATTPLVVSGTCGPNLIVKIFNNGALAGTGVCTNSGTFIINIGLLEGRNNLKALNYDEFNRAGPASPTVTVYVINESTLTDTTTLEGNALNVQTRQRNQKQGSGVISWLKEILSNNPVRTIARLINFGDSRQSVSISQQVFYVGLIILLVFIIVDLLVLDLRVSRALRRFVSRVVRFIRVRFHF